MIKKQHKRSDCSNCGFKFSKVNNYCPQCGQKNHELKIPLKHLIEEFIESTLHLDTKIFQTLKYLIFYPGQLSHEYNDGKRVKYVPPVRLYIIASFLFFFLLNVFSPKGSEADHNPKGRNSGAAINFTVSGISVKDLSGLSETQADSLVRARGVEKSFYNKYLIAQLYKMANGGMGEFIHSFIKNISYMMFILMPVFALLIYLAFKRETNYFIEGLIISVHFHSFIFLLMSFLLLIGLVKTILFVMTAPLIVIFYLFFMLRRYYRQKNIITFTKTITIGLLHLLLFLFMIVGTMLISVMIL